MIPGSYVQYESGKAAEDTFEAMELLSGRVELEGIHYIDDKTAAASLDLALMMAALDAKDQR